MKSFNGKSVVLVLLVMFLALLFVNGCSKSEDKPPTPTTDDDTQLDNQVVNDVSDVKIRLLKLIAKDLENKRESGLAKRIDGAFKYYIFGNGSSIIYVDMAKECWYEKNLMSNGGIKQLKRLEKELLKKKEDSEVGMKYSPQEYFEENYADDDIHEKGIAILDKYGDTPSIFGRKRR